MNQYLNKYSSGENITVGSYNISILNYLSEGGFAHIYKVKINSITIPSSKHSKSNTNFNSSSHINPNLINSIACLKRVLVKDEEGLKQLQSEIDYMKLLSNSNCPYIVNYIDSQKYLINQSQSPSNPQCQFFVLMELCSKNSLLDLMNQRLVNRLTEFEILSILHDISLAITCMHHLTNPLIHRDIKIENVLINDQNIYKLCDFGSTCPVLRSPRNNREFQILKNDIYKQTTPQYRSPEMINLYKNIPINQKSDIWALGVFLYKLCFYTTPFENNLNPEFAIENSIYSIPTNSFSSDLINLIKAMLQLDPTSRPNIYQIVIKVCSLVNINVPDNVYDKEKRGPYDFDSLSYPISNNTQYNQSYEDNKPAAKAATNKPTANKPTANKSTANKPTANKSTANKSTTTIGPISTKLPASQKSFSLRK
ncbi:kinase-like protein [Ascoidea rubescens DSM 1968]|uniref:Kinase-like protein n=1 Tax=Ascoidea rubescens DSM 1968 TaxID=1344418 RepID=A0A1D2VE59_9ASCO|nr:kinase-like protein [Ascoidea rubescens DSM 1968]ODV59916.1 kinase-like protein [Ascoidea rubescens DSM 1968]